MKRDPLNDDDYDGNDDQIEDLKNLVEDLQGTIADMTIAHDRRVTGLINANSDNVNRRRGLSMILKTLRPALSDEGRKRVDFALEEHRGR